MFLAVLSGLRRQDGRAPRRVAAEGRGQGDHVQLPPDEHWGSVEFQRAKAPVPTRGSVRVRLFVWRSKAGCPVVATSQWPLRRAPRPFATAFPTHAVCNVLFPHLILLLACFLPSSLPTHATRESSGTREYTGGVLGGPPNASPPGHARPPARVEGTYANIPPEMCHSPSGTAIACGVEEQAPRKSSGRG